MRRIAVAALAAGFAAGALAAGQAPAPKLSADEIVEKNAAARGGLDAWRQVRTMVWVGHIESAHAPQFIECARRKMCDDVVGSFDYVKIRD